MPGGQQQLESKSEHVRRAGALGLGIQQREAANRQIAMQNAPASKCLSLIPMTQSNFGGFINSCAFGVSVTWCNDGASDRP